MPPSPDIPGRAAVGGSCAVLAALLFGWSSASADVTYRISGIKDPLLSNVRRHVEEFSLTGSARVSTMQFDEIVTDAEARAREALKPYGYYQPSFDTELVRNGREDWRVEMRINRGPPVRVAAADIVVRGPGSDLGTLAEWQLDWPLAEGKILNQVRWEEQKDAALDLLKAEGYLSANYVLSAIELDLVRNEATLKIVLDTGPQAVFGDVVFRQDVVKPEVLHNIPRFERGSPYSAELLAKFRYDLWSTGYFTDIRVETQEHLDRDPPTVDLVATLETTARNTYQGTLGFGTDTGFRTQAFWKRRLLSSRGDRLDVGIGYQELDDEFSVRADYRIPRRTETRQFWVANASVQSENQDLEFKRSESDEGFVKLANGSVNEFFLRLGNLRVRDRKQGYRQIFETVFAQYLRTSYNYDPGADATPEVIAIRDDPVLGRLFRDTVGTLALGVEWDWPAITGNEFETQGHHEQAWIFTASDSWGSDRDFTQVYASSRRSYLKGERFKILLRAEAGFTDAAVDTVFLDIGGESLPLSVTRLPNRYRFKAGGSNSVRGYGFEDLSNNDIGSNHIVTASAEVEMRVLPKWSIAAFFDVGNAFNDWDERNLKKGIGAGIRWYSIAGPIRVDIAQALDVEGKPLRLHFTLGSPLL